MPASRQFTFLLVAGLGVALGGCAAAPPAETTPAPAAAQPQVVWPVRAREHIDLWLHGWGQLHPDTTTITYFRRGYADSVVRVKREQDVTTSLDANAEQLRARLVSTPRLTNGQFVPLYFGSWEELRGGADLFMQAGGDPRRASNQQSARIIAFFAASFPTAPDREWLRLFLLSLEDERRKFYGAEWQVAQEGRAPIFAAVDSLWQRHYRTRFRDFLNNTQQVDGDFTLSLPIGGEGRTVPGGRTQNVVVVTFPDSRDRAIEAIYVFAHEIVGALAQQAVADNTTPAERREGVAERIQSDAAVRTGALLLQRVAPELAEGYARYYLRIAGHDAASGDVQTALATAFPLPDAVRDAIARQLDIVLSGI